MGRRHWIIVFLRLTRMAFIACLLLLAPIIPAYAFDPCGSAAPDSTDAASALVTPFSLERTASSGSKSLRRLSGDTRYDTMAAISEEGFDRASTVVIASGDNFPDALAASSLAGALDSPILLTSGSSLSPQTESEVRRLGATRAIILGGEAAVSRDVEARLGSLGLNVQRIAGALRQNTAEQIAQELSKMVKPDTAIIASAYAPWDSLSVSSYAYSKNAPVFLTSEDDVLSDATLAAIGSIPSIKRIVIVGGPSAVSSRVESQLSAYSIDRWWGQTRYETSACIAENAISEGLSASCAAFASGASFPDALSGGALVGERGGVTLLVSPASLGEGRSFIFRHWGSMGACFILGGSQAIAPAVEAEAHQALGLDVSADDSGVPVNRTVLVFSPHQDDEVLSMGSFVSRAEEKGCDVKAMLCTDGSKSWVREELSNGLGCDFHGGKHVYSLSVPEFVDARDAEFELSCKALGAECYGTSSSSIRAKDGELTLTQAKSIIRAYLAKYPDAVVCTMSPLVGQNQHSDHRTLGQAALDLYKEGLIKDLRLFVEPYNLSEFLQNNPEVGLCKTSAQTERGQAAVVSAVGAYANWSPSSGRYAIGYHSVGPSFDLLEDSEDVSLWHTGSTL